MPLSVRQIGDTVICNKEPKEHYKKVFLDIGKHFEENAERYAENAVDIHVGMKIEINLPISDIITISITTNEYLKGEY